MYLGYVAHIATVIHILKTERVNQQTDIPKYSVVSLKTSRFCHLFKSYVYFLIVQQSLKNLSKIDIQVNKLKNENRKR